MFFKKKVTLNLYTDRADVYHWSQLQEAKKHKPKWWRDLKSESDAVGTEASQSMRHCAGFNKLFAKAFFAPMWCEAHGHIYPDGNWQFSFADQVSMAREHPASERGKFMADDKYQNIKFISPWYASCDESVDFLFTNADYFDESNKDLIVLNGVVDFKNQSSLNINTMIKRSADCKEIFIKKDTPMYMLIPLTERRVVLKHHLVTTQDLKRMSQKKFPTLYFVNNYRKIKSCPFHTE